MKAPTVAVTRDIVVIGSSAGGVEALPRVLQQLPADLAAAVFIVQHIAPTKTPYLASILARSSRIPVGWAEQGARVEHGRVLVAPPDVHLLIAEDHVQLTGGARENHSRPSIDKLFRSAAAGYGSRVIGVLLTGMLDDGVAGLRTIRRAGGTVIVQDPADAAFPDLPSHALTALTPDRTLPLDAIGAAIASLVGEHVQMALAPPDLAIEAAMDRRGSASPDQMNQLGPQTALACPECHGPLWHIGDEDTRRFRCYLGHVTTARELLDASAGEVESALWSAVRALNDRAGTLETLATDARTTGSGQSAAIYASRAREVREQAELARRFMLDLGRPK
jgi:two-component system, chemotaxis family, protein-glutamate methylesterase/glutaminase